MFEILLLTLSITATVEATCGDSVRVACIQVSNGDANKLRNCLYANNSIRSHICMQTKRALFYKNRTFNSEPFVVEQQFSYSAGLLQRQRYKSVIVEDGVYLLAFEIKDPVHVKKYKDIGHHTLLLPGRYSDLLSLGDFSQFRVVPENCTHSIDIGLNIISNINSSNINFIHEEEDSNNNIYNQISQEQQYNKNNNSSKNNFLLTLTDIKQIDIFTGGNNSSSANDRFNFQASQLSGLKQCDIPRHCNSTNRNEAILKFCISEGNTEIEKGTLLIKLNENNGFYSVTATSDNQFPKQFDIQQIGRSKFIFQYKQNPKPQTTSITN
ncbi:hypothetical protein PPL_02736 [Heterostelium album PN500]|uniref:Uncharacterized protein n=1 Tax=Heterostelium pallidum (strain ATCC 26659 / Pp 5 / PN500) TaxID=670386 RepID=D3B2X2_HETP5|nr:hypothetical protein PPL_02736 [Heterostelium album PN500]EFA83670.1 hypothetical protein PPL_02736 [Heterostelium album PN500]|eukprot:XP_020435787.1 hypothetical protein PPL_02736 [Heterostelium album PN500]